MKSIYDPEDLRCTNEGLEMKMEAETWFKSMLEKYPDSNPREMVELFSGSFGMMAARRILELRRSGVLKGY
jgi:hypothetical protein